MASKFPATADLYSSLTGTATLPVVEVDRAIVEVKRKRIVKAREQWPPQSGALETTTLGHALTELHLREWAVYHAAAKTALARGGLSAEEHDYAAGTYLQNRHLVIWNRGNLRLRRGGIFSRMDAARTSATGRFGEAVLYLFMKERDYKYWDHIPALVERALNKNAVPHKEQLRFTKMVKSSFPDGVNAGKRPDFAFEKQDGESALAEAKGGSIEQGEAPSMVKGDLSQGLLQLAAWSTSIRPRAKKSFVVGTYLRELGDAHTDPSLVAFVDPEDATPSDALAVEFPVDWIRRGNYGAWLIGMGFPAAGEALRNGEEIRTTPRMLPIITIGSHRYAFTHDACCLPEWWLPEDPFVHMMMRRYSMRRRNELHVPIFGIEVDTLHAAEKSVNNASQPLVVDTDAMTSETAFPEWFSGSIFPDGTLMGAIHILRPGFLIDDEEKFRL